MDLATVSQAATAIINASPRLAHALPALQEGARNLVMNHPTMTGLVEGTAIMFAGGYTAIAFGQYTYGQEMTTPQVLKRIAKRGAALIALTAAAFTIMPNSQLPATIGTAYNDAMYPYGGILGLLGCIAFLTPKLIRKVQQQRRTTAAGNIAAPNGQ